MKISIGVLRAMFCPQSREKESNQRQVIVLIARCSKRAIVDNANSVRGKCLKFYLGRQAANILKSKI